MRLSGRAVVDVEYVSLPATAGQRRRKKRQALSKEEVDLRRSETARRRRAQAHMKAEEVKINTIHKLLRRQASKRSAVSKDGPCSNSEGRPRQPSIRYLRSGAGSFLSIPLAVLERSGVSLEAEHLGRYPEPRRCSVEGCSGVKMYERPASGLRACCLEHYEIICKL